MRSQLFENIENTTNEGRVFVKQNDFALLVNLKGKAYALQGSMVAYKGNIDFDYKSIGASRLAKSFATGDSLPLMTMSGEGDVYLAQNGQMVHVVELENDTIYVNSRNVLAFSEGVDWNIGIIKAGMMGFATKGLFSATLTGTGSVAIMSTGTPIVIPVNGGEVYSDVNSILAWSTGLETSVKSSFKMKQLIGLSSGESFQMAFSGQGYIIVQPGEFAIQQMK